jgi:hypothetical protein
MNSMYGLVYTVFAGLAVFKTLFTIHQDYMVDLL